MKGSLRVIFRLQTKALQVLLKWENRRKYEEKGGKETQQNLPFYLIVHQHEVVNDMYENKLCDFHE